VEGITLDTPVNEILRHYPEAVKLLSSLGLDTCCGGAEPLKEAARQAGQEPAQVLQALLGFLEAQK
jgi:iron-sulfur cluster repair protein YtfE (RIC family)